jgi:hypothetical protein
MISFNGYPRKISSSWKGLDKLPGGSKNIDAAFKSADEKKYFVFKDDMYVEYYINKDNISDTLGATAPLTIKDNWPGLNKFIDGANNIDAAFCDSKGEKYYFFKGIQYIRYYIKKREVDKGYPKIISFPLRWKGLEDFKDGAGNFDSILKSNDSKKYYFFKGDEYIRYDIEKEKADKGYPKKINENWIGLNSFNRKSTKIDTVIVNSDNTKYYFFMGDEYISYDIEKNFADVGWPGLNSFKDGASNIDTVLISNDRKKAFFFKGNQYISYDIKKKKVDKGYPKNILSKWPGLDKFSGGANNIDATLFNPNGTKLYFFKKNQYIRYDIKTNRIDMGYPKSITKNWKGLNKFKSKSESVVNGAFLSPDNKKYYFISGNEYIIYDISDDKVDKGYPKKLKSKWKSSDRFNNYDAIVLWPDPLAKFSMEYKNPTYYQQGDQKWSRVMYSSIRSHSQTIGSSGCGPTSMAMVLTSLTSNNVHPPELCSYSVRNNFRTISEGTSWDFFPSASKKYGINCSTLTKTDFSEIKKSLKTGSYMAVASMREGYFTNGGHYIVLYGIETLNGEIFIKVLDPNKNNRSYNKGRNGVLIDKVKNDGKVSVREDILKDEAKGFWLFTQKIK